MKKFTIALCLTVIALFGNMSAGEINDAFGAEIENGNTGTAVIENKGKTPIWVAVLPKENMNTQSTRTTLVKAGATIGLSANKSQGSILAIWQKEPAKITVTKRIFFGYTIDPEPKVTHAFTLSKENIFLEFNNGIKEKK